MATIGSIIPSLPPQSIEVLEDDIKISLKHLLSRNVDTSTHIESVLFFLLFKTQGTDKSFYFELPFIQGNSIGVNVTVQSSYLLTTSYFPRTTTPSPTPTPTPSPTPTPTPDSYPNSTVYQISDLDIYFVVQNTANGSQVTIANNTLTEYTFGIKHNSTNNIIEFNSYFIPDNTTLSFNSTYTFSTTDLYSFSIIQYETNNAPITQLFYVSSYEPIPDWFPPSPSPSPTPTPTPTPAPTSGVIYFDNIDVSFSVQNTTGGSELTITNNTSAEYTFDVVDNTALLVIFNSSTVPSNAITLFTSEHTFTTNEYTITLVELNSNNQFTKTFYVS